MKPGLFAAVVVAVFLLGFAVGRSTASSGLVAGTGSGAMPPARASQEEAAPPARVTVTGVVDEVIQVPNYTYLKLSTGSGEEWAAVNATTSVQKGQHVSIANGAMMTNFTSSTLKRTFPSIWFGQLMEGAEAAAAPMGGSAAPMRAGGTGATAGALAALAKAEGPLGLRVADIYAERRALVGKAVRVRGSVAKVNEVQGLYYVHVKDGSGTAAAGDDDVTVVTKSSVTAGAVVTLEGTVAVDKDLGMGPRAVVLEGATLVER